jgi:Carboxypeptidase regulatory-like domain
MTHKISMISRSIAAFVGVFVCLMGLLAAPSSILAQTGGEGTLAGTVTDSTGAAVPGATVTATNAATNVATERTTSSAGVYTIAPLPPGIYSVQVTAKGFKTLRQDNLSVDALGVLSFSPVLSVGETTETIVVTAAPPVLDTSNATLGMVMENDTYANLPLQMNNAQRDATAFGALTPGAQGGSRLPVIGGTGNYLGQLYLDGMPAETISQQGDNRLVSESVDLDAVDQFQVVTSTPPAEYSGAGSMNFTMKSGGVRYHGQVSDFIRNTIFDAWSFTAKAATTKNAAGATIPAPKPVEHQNELSASFGWKAPKTHDKLFFFAAYDKFHERKGAAYSLYTIPSTLMRAGDFTELNGNVGGGGQSGTTGSNATAYIYDPSTNSCVGTACTRTPYQGAKNGVPTYNVIPSSEISSIAKAMQSFLPAPTNPSVLTNNYLGGLPSGFDNFVINYRVDFDLSAKQRISTIGALGTVNYLNNYAAGGSAATAYGFLPPPYVGGDLANIYPKVFDVEDTYTISDRMTNQLKYGFTRFYQNIHDATQGVTAWSAATLGITNLPAGQAGQEFPGAQFAETGGATNTLTGWTQNSNAAATQLTTPNNFTIVDNLQWLKGKHALTFGITYQWQEINNANPATYTGVLDLSYNSNSTANFTAGSSALSASSGYSYASYLLGAVGGTPSIGLQPVSEEGGRYRPVSPYVEDSFKMTPKLTLDLGLRWDYFPPYREVKDHWTFLNPNITNSATGTPGMLQFAGNYGGAGVSCGCRTPVNTYWKNWGPRVGLAYSVDDKTVLRIGFGEVFSEAGGVGGRGGAFNGTGQTGFNVTATGPAETTSGASAGPSFYLNNNTSAPASMQNTSLFGATYSYPANPTPNAAAQLLNAGNYVSPTTGKIVTASTVSFADPYLSGRAPEFNFYNVGIERGITKDMTLAVNYVGDQSHFLINSTSSGANARGYWAGQLDPKYLAGLGSATGLNATSATVPLLNAPATPANVAKAQAVMAGITIPTFFQNAAAAFPTTSTLTIAQGLLAFPQYSGVSDTWGENVGNFSYNSLQITLLQRMAHGLSFNINYTYSKNIGDDGTFRSGYYVPSGAISGGGQNWKQDRIDRSWTTISTPQSLHAFGVYQLPFGKGKLGGSSMLVRALAGGWQVSGIYTYSSGTPMAVTWNGTTGTTYPGQGAAMPDLAPSSTPRNARINGSFGTGPAGTTTCNLGIGTGCTAIPYVDKNAFAVPANISTVSGSPQYLIGNAPRTRPLNLNNPGTQDLDSSIRRSFSLPEKMSLVIEVDCLNTWNKVTFSAPNATFGSTAFGTITGIANTPRDFQFAGHINF